jgi:uncharacterized protein
MSFLEIINHNGYEVITSLVVANIIAQVIKTLIFAAQNGFLDTRMLVTTGGMPSSHSASVVAMATTVGQLEGFESIAFALSVTFSVVVMYDSAGVRRAAGKQAAILNRIIAELVSDTHKVKEGRLKELLGHSPKEVFVGAVLGVLISIALRSLIVTYV